jgi:hypothetical protein
MTIQREQRRSSGLGVMAVLVSVLLLVGLGITMIYRLSTSQPPSKLSPHSASAEATFASRKPPRVVRAAAPVTVPTSAGADSPAASRPQLEAAREDEPFVDARRERRDPVWALQTESGVRSGLAALRDKKVTLEEVRCASIRCTLEGTIGQGGSLQAVVRALHDTGLTRGRFKRVRGDDGTTTFSAVFARKGYELDGSLREVVSRAP